MSKKLHPSLLPLVFCAAVIIIDVVALATGRIAKPETKTWSSKTTEAEPLLLDFKTDFKDRIKSALPDESEGLALGYLLGDKSELGATLKETIAAVGLTHLIVASGAHLGIILKFAKKSFGKISRAAGLFANLAAVALFIGIIGLTPSALRAGLVAVLSLLAAHFGRDLKPGRLLLYAAATTLLVDPTYPLNLSWLLSFASFTAVLLVAPALETYFYGPQKSANSKNPSTLASLLLASLSATLLTAPILLFYFGQISLISVLANLLISPTLALTMLMTFLTGLLPNPVTALGAHLLVQYHIAVASTLADQTAFLVSIDKNNPLVFLLYLPLLPVFLFLYRKNKIFMVKTKALC
ncbi:ComEC/Rec2 family competence protein [Candidatus Saccharibacteria bacterium]|nr:ComEC/Rec2 family competence protein [Candidatus Saccharibacteria bacterium]